MKKLLIPLLLSISTLGFASTEVIAEWVALEDIQSAIVSTGNPYPELNDPSWKHVKESITRDTETNVITHYKGYTNAAVTVGAGIDETVPPVVEQVIKERHILYSASYTDTSPPLLISMILVNNQVYLLSRELNPYDIVAEGENLIYDNALYTNTAESSTITTSDDILEIQQHLIPVIPALTCDPFAGTSKSALIGLLNRWTNLYADEATKKQAFNSVGSMFDDVDVLRARIDAFRILVNGCPE